MPKRKHQRRLPRQKAPKSSPRTGLREVGAADAVTIAWTVSVTAVFMADLVAAAAHFYLLAHPESRTTAAVGSIMLLSACVIGLVSLALLPVVWRVRRVKPPLGFAVFAGSVAAAPVMAVVVRLMT